MKRFLLVIRALAAAMTVILTIVAISGEIEALADGNSGAINAISLAEFSEKTEYINKLVPGSENPQDANYYGRPSFYNSEAGEAKFTLASGEMVSIYDGEIGFNCDILGVENYMVDFTGVDLNDISRSESTSEGATYENGKAGVKNADAFDTRTKAEKAAMLQNALFLQSVEYCAAGMGTTITIPKGEFYFAIGHHYNRKRNTDGTYSGGAYVIKPVDGVNVSGRGVGNYASAIAEAIRSDNASIIDQASNGTNGNNATILKPYTNAAYYEAAAPDMFFYNEYTGSGFTNAQYLRDVRYSNFIIDGEDAVGYAYTSGGKGFMYNLFENVQWDTVVVKNTDGTGFGVDAPKGRNNLMVNCLALNNGKKALPGDGNEYPGASGFGIGTGYGDDETLTIKDSVAYGNAKFGFFFEHQNRFQNPSGEVYPYNATMGAGNAVVDPGTINLNSSRAAFVVSGSLAADNFYNYGGMRAYDVKLSNSTSVAGCTGRLAAGTYYEKTTCTRSNVYYSGDTRRVDIDDVEIKTVFADASDASSWYYDAIKWAVGEGIIYGVSENKFGVGQQMYRRDALVILWRMMGYPGTVVTQKNNNQSDVRYRDQKIETCFADVPENSYYAAAVKWAFYDRYKASSNASMKGRIIVGTAGCSDPFATSPKDGSFAPDTIVTRGEFVTMLYRLAGEPAVSGKSVFTDIDEDKFYYKAAIWAAANGITNGVGDNKFAGESDCTREQVVTFLYRYYQRYGAR